MRKLCRYALGLLMTAAVCLLLSPGVRAWEQSHSERPPVPAVIYVTPEGETVESSDPEGRAEASVLILYGHAARGAWSLDSELTPEDVTSIELRLQIELSAPEPPQPEAAEAPAPEQTQPEEPAPAAPREAERSWTYISSDGRPLWRLRLAGRFLEGSCLQAWGEAEAISEAWRIESAEFRPDGAEAAALVTVTRQALGVLVARETYEFRLPPPEAER